MDRLSRSHLSTRNVRNLALTATAFVLVTWPVAGFADSARRQPPPSNYIAECASCHAPFPARMLPAASWSAIMNTLNRHYGVDASLDGSAARELTRWLTDNASQRSANRPPDDRLTLSADFIRKHREVPTTTWSKAAVKSPANCAACHGDAAEGAFRERNVRIPR